MSRVIYIGIALELSSACRKKLHSFDHGQSDRLLVPTKEIYKYCNERVVTCNKTGNMNLQEEEECRRVENNTISFDTFNNSFAMEIPTNVLRLISMEVETSHETNKNVKE